ncbi:hypothetical protein ACGF5M_00825 [Gemmatimonadota bacterium]
MSEEPEEREDLHPPDASAGDRAHAVVRAGLSSIPVVGGSAAELFLALVTPPLERRRQEWMASVGEALQTLSEDEGIDLDALGDDPAFIDTVLQASNAALRTSQEAKREALLNAILNSATPSAPDAVIRHIFIGLVDEFTDWHLRVLALFDDPASWFEGQGQPRPNIHMGGLNHILGEAYPSLASRRDLYDQIWKDLYSSGLVSTEGLHTMMSEQGLFQRRSTDLGREFLEFLRNPVAAEE